MADKKISALTGATTPLAGTEVLPIVQSGATVKVAVSDLTAGRAVSATALTMTTGNLTPSTAAKGINFTANTPAAGMTSQLLDWYEHGTWTPADNSGGVVVTGSGYYTRIGNQVTAWCQVDYPVTADGSSATITGLPFTVKNQNAMRGGVALGYKESATLGGILVQANTKNFLLRTATGGAVTNVQMSNTSFVCSITYQVA
jgi:hypothetical protein